MDTGCLGGPLGLTSQRSMDPLGWPLLMDYVADIKLLLWKQSLLFTVKRSFKSF